MATELWIRLDFYKSERIRRGQDEVGQAMAQNERSLALIPGLKTPGVWRWRFILSNASNQQANNADINEDIGNIEHGEIDQTKLQKIHDAS